MQLNDIVKTLDQMTDKELLERVRELRHRRETIRPAAAKHVERSEKKASQKKVTGVEKLLGVLTHEERQALIEQLGG